MSELCARFNIELNDTTTRKIVIIPLEGCGKCIKQAVNDITNESGKIFVLSCFSKKTARMVVGDSVLMYPNVYVDERSFSVKYSLVTTVPILYQFKGKKCVLKRGY